MTDDTAPRCPQGGHCHAHEALERAADVYAERSAVWARLNPWSWYLDNKGGAHLQWSISGTPEDSIACSRGYIKSHRMEMTTVAFVFALPGMGKSTVSSCVLDSIDADYGNWRRAYGYSREAMDIFAYRAQLESFMDMLGRSVFQRLQRARDGGPVIVFLNNLDLIPYVRALGYRAVMVLPSERFVPEWLRGIQTREERKVPLAEGEYRNFAEKAADRHKKWISDWRWAGKRNAIPIHSLDSWMTGEFIRRAIPGAVAVSSGGLGPGPNSGTESR